MVMQTVTLTIELPEEDIQEAQALGILTPEAVTAWVKSQLGWREDAALVQQIRADLQRLPDPLTPDEIQAELEAHRAEKQAKRAHRD